jgi:mRNA-degrading endonuclease RelE of RelBE toxin-antitoxin system
MAYAVYTLNVFDKKMEKLSYSDQEIIRKMFIQLKENPYTGDQIRYKFFREKRLRESRIYYLVYDDISIVLLVAIGGKKAQQETINEIVKYFKEYRRYAEELSNSSHSSGF